ncbi:hypothetical protein H072_9858 [Dactylellina haptotyla CBS 200.50]|uniref:Rhamnogalacturonase A/B/Epimerase-like pectate lyase domain-containing protein n=1 Tax=Dactylellina haptotyla (strain CBS 200.50) TaxID=1284197 RepID=S8BBT1_DACHA|nr:hypothetical protein H072_9858 [Dactylellina haptotyla CBS 200.50]
MGTRACFLKLISIVTIWVLSIHFVDAQSTTTSLACHADNVLRALKNTQVISAAVTFCSTFPASTTNPLPTYVSQFPASRVSSACRCLTVTSTTTSSTTTSAPSVCGTPDQYPYYFDKIKHQGLHPANASYSVYRNIKCWGAVGDGVTDDSDAIIRALTEAKLCKSTNCDGYYVPPSLVYFPYGRYLVRKSLPLYKNTQLVGSALTLPVIVAAADFSGGAIIETKVSESIGGGIGDFITIRNINIIGSDIPTNRLNTAAIKWNAGQASSIHNVGITMGYYTEGNTHRGILVENSAHVFMSDISIQQGRIGIELSAQGGTIRSSSIQYTKECAIKINSNYAFTLKDIFIYNTPIGIDSSKTVVASGKTSQPVNSFIFLEGEITQCPVLVKTARGGSSNYPIGAGTAVLERLTLGPNVVAVKRDNGVTVFNPSPATGNRLINSWAQGRRYAPPQYTPLNITGVFQPTKFYQPLLKTEDDKYAQKSRPTYNNWSAGQLIISVRTLGAKGDGVTDDTVKVQQALDQAASTSALLFIDYGIYLVTKTLTVHPGTRIVGEAWPKIMASGTFFTNSASPQPVLKIGQPGDQGLVEIQDIVVTAKGGSSGAISYQWNLKGATQNGDMSGMWDAHSIIGAQPFSNLEPHQCAHNSASTSIRRQCIGAFMHIHLSRSSAFAYLENTYFASAAYQNTYTTQPSSPLSIYVGRGVFIDGSAGSHFLSAVSADNSIMYQYQIVNSANVFASMLQGTNPSFQPNPMAPAPFTTNTAWSDPDFGAMCGHKTGVELAKCAKAFGLRIVNSDNVVIYSTALLAGGLNNYGTCPGGSFNCQLVMIRIDGQKRSPVDKYVNIDGLTVRGARYGMILEGKIIIDSQVNAGTSLALPVVAWWYVGGEAAS